MNNIAIIIPSLNPSDKLLSLVKDLQEEKFKHIFIINDGSEKKYNHIFDKLKKMNCQIYYHDSNQGKGIAIKTGLKEASKLKEITGFITADADGQHLAKDIKRVAQELDKNQDELILGVRNLNGRDVPLRSRVGNTFSSIYFYLNTKIYLKDTQTGLRGIPKSLVNRFLKIEGERYEYEMNVLLEYAKHNKIITLDIETIYEDNNSGSHFNTIRDSYLVYEILIKYLLIYILTIVIAKIFSSLNLFSLIYFLTIPNYILTKYWIFKSSVILKLTIIYFLVHLFEVFLIGIINFTLFKILLIIIMFGINYLIDKNLIFNKGKYE